MQNFLKEPERKWVQDTFDKLEKKVAAECGRMKGKIPYVAVKDVYEDYGEENISWWTNGFWAGIMWQMYHATGRECYRDTAVGVEQRLDEALTRYEELHHDVGFMWMHTAVANYRLTGSEDARRRGRHAAGILAGRYNPEGKYICAWNVNRPGWIIIDCLMNLSLLYWASETDQDPRFRMIAEKHADTALEKLMRPDGSCHHISVLDPENGDLLENPLGQGFATGSSWSRGQSWAVYGFAISYAHTQEQRYLDAAKRAAHYFLANVAMTDYLPLCDFRSPAEPVYYDATAGACAACGMLEIARHVPEYEKSLYVMGAVRILQAMEQRFADWNVETDGFLTMGKVSYHGQTYEPQEKIIYGDYFFTEAILRLLEKDFRIW